MEAQNLPHGQDSSLASNPVAFSGVSISLRAQQAPSPEIQGRIHLTNPAKPIIESSAPQLIAWRFPVQSGGKKKKILQGPTDPLYFGMTILNDKRNCTQLCNAPLAALTGSLPIS